MWKIYGCFCSLSPIFYILRLGIPLQVVVSYYLSSKYSAAKNKWNKPCFMYWNKVFEWQFLESKNVATTQPSYFQFVIKESFKMRYCMTLYLKGHQKYSWSKLKVLFLLSKSRTFNFDLLYFWCSLRYKVIQYLILKLSIMVYWNLER